MNLTSKLLLVCALGLTPMACGNGVLTPKKLYCYVGNDYTLAIEHVSRWRRDGKLLEIELPDGNKMFHLLVDGETCLSLYQQAPTGETNNDTASIGDLSARKRYGIRLFGDYTRGQQLAPDNAR